MMLYGVSIVSNNSEAWNQSNVVNFFNKHRMDASDVYPSEWFFLNELLQENISILDIGCAQGGFATIIGKKLRNFSYTGLDISQNMITQAKLKHPKHNFHHIKENDYSILESDGGMFDLTIVLGILHLHETWRETIKKAWLYTSGALLLDLRESFEETVEDKEKSYFGMDINGKNEGYSGVLPYNIINASEALSTISSICVGATKISRYGYTTIPSDTTTTSIEKIFTNVYCIEKL
jgi:SAM-dependent methyltransferase